MIQKTREITFKLKFLTTTFGILLLVGLTAPYSLNAKKNMLVKFLFFLLSQKAVAQGCHDSTYRVDVFLNATSFLFDGDSSVG